MSAASRPRSTSPVGWAFALGNTRWQAPGSGTYQTYFLGLLAEVLNRQGRREEARRVLDEVLTLARQTGEGLSKGELCTSRSIYPWELRPG